MVAIYRGWIQFGSVELANAARVVRYLENRTCRTSVAVAHDDSWPDTHTFLGQQPYVTPDEDGAPWYSTAVPESVDFYGVWPMQVEGLDSTDMERSVLESAGSGAVFGIPRAGARRIKVEALLIAATPEGAEYGLQWFNAVLRGDECDEFDQPRRLQYLDVTPPVSVTDTDAEVVAAGQRHLRTLYDVVLTRPVEVTDRFGQYLPERRQATCFRVEFELTAGNPFIWKHETSLTDPVVLASGQTTTVSFERQVEGVCPSACPPTAPPLVDPSLPPPEVLPRPLTPASAVGCQPIQSKRTRVTIPADRVRQYEQVIPTVVILTGAQAERNIRVQWVRGDDVDDLQCASIGEVMIGYIPPHSMLTLDGVTGQATSQGPDGQVVDATGVVSGRLGGPWRVPVLRCGSNHTVVLDAATNVSASVQAVISGMVRTA